MEVYIKIEMDGELIGFIRFENEEVLAENEDFFNGMFDNGFQITRSSEQEYNEFDGGDELTIDDIQNGNYRIDDNVD
jgi:hypothetical protein